MHRKVGGNSAAGMLERIPGRPALDLGAFDLNDVGYVAEEFFLADEADAFSADARSGHGVQRASSAFFRTRCVVVRPTEPEHFNGAVLVEWLNVSMGRDLPADWGLAHREIVRTGSAYVGISAQKTGVEGGASLSIADQPLTKVDPARYGSLKHPGDEYSYSIFSKAGAELRQDGDSIFGRAVHTWLAVGASQSASYLVTYINRIDPVHQVYDGYLLHGRGSNGALIDGAYLFDRRPEAKQPVYLRTDLRVPVLTLLSETDVMGFRLELPGFPMENFAGYYVTRQPDSEHLRVWEVAGSSHATGYMFNVSPIDSGSLSIADMARAYRPTREVAGTSLDKPINPDPQQHYVMEAALSHLGRWVRSGISPPAAVPLLITGGFRAGGELPRLILDANGNALGGVRTPWVDVPTARMSGQGNSGGPVAFLAGSYEAYDSATLAAMYPGGRDDYLSKFDQSLQSAIAKGFLLPAHESEIRALAEAMYGT